MHHWHHVGSRSGVLLTAQHAKVIGEAPRILRTVPIHTTRKLHTHPIVVPIVETNMRPTTTVEITAAKGAATVVSQSVARHFHWLNDLVSSLRLLVEHLVHTRTEATCNAIPTHGLLILHA